MNEETLAMIYTPSPRDPKQPPVRINLLSDTQTRPTPAMREAIARAEVGDEQIGDDPTVNVLCERVADLLGKEAAVFMPSGTMCNVAATLSHCRPGDEILAHETAHVIAREGGAHAALGGFQITALPGADGQFTPDTFRKALHPRTRYQPPQVVVSVEQTANIGGGTIWKKADLDEIVKIAKANGLITHMDGARLLNACVATGIGAARHGGGMGLRLARFLQGPRRARRRCDRGLARFHRRRLALEAAPRRLDAPGRHLRGGLRLRARPPCRPAGGRSRQCQGAGARPVADRRHGSAAARNQPGVLQTRRRRNPRRRDGRSLHKRGVLLAMMDGRIRACTHLDVTADMIEETVGLVRDIVRERRAVSAD